jgi:CD2 antigen cytoplasmic tail-binding protein 2
LFSPLISPDSPIIRTKADVDSMLVGKPSTQSSDIDHITHIASSLMSLGDTDIYSKTYQELVRAVRSAGNVEPSWEPPSADVKYQYKWDVPGADTDGEAFGPFGEDEMRGWYKASYFGVAGEKIKVREVGGEWGDWNDVLP